MTTQVILATYTCSSRYGGPHPCSATQFWAPFVIVGVVAVFALVSHQGYRHRRGRSSIFSRANRSEATQPLAFGEESGPSGQVDQAPRHGGTAPSDGLDAADGGVGFGAAVSAPMSASGPPAPEPRPSGADVPLVAHRSAPMGWFPDPERPGEVRFWSGVAWAPSGVVPPGAPPPPAPLP